MRIHITHNSHLAPTCLALLWLVNFTACGSETTRKENTKMSPNPVYLRDESSEQIDMMDRSAVLERRYISDTGAKADALILDVIAKRRVFFTQAAQQIVSGYELVGTELRPMELTGLVPQKWAKAEAELYGGGFQSIINRPLSEQAALYGAYAEIVEVDEGFTLYAEHGATVMETFLSGSPERTVVYADDFQNTSDDCSAYESDEQSIQQRFDAYFKSYMEIIERHKPRVIVRSMRRRSKGNFEYVLRKCDNASFKEVEYFQQMEQMFLDRLSRESGLIIVNGAHNDPEPETFWIDGSERLNPVVRHTARTPFFVGYVDQPDLDFFPEGVVARPNWIPSNQKDSVLAADLYIDGNIDSGKVEAASRWYFEAQLNRTTPGSLSELIQTIQDKGFQWWNEHSFRYISGQINGLPTTGTVVTSGMATSWATPLAAGMILRLANEQSIDIRTEEGQAQMRERVQGRIFDPLVHRNY